MRSFLAPLLVVGGCGFSVSPGSQDTTDAGVIDGAKPVDGTPKPDDDDGDGVMNASDNCPSEVNPMQFNEDGDARGDECDPCPQLASAADDQDADGDTIGNGCDPHPTVPGDVLAYWNGFHTGGTALPNGMAIVHGSAARWTIGEDQLVFTRSGEDWHMPVIDVANTHHTVDTVVQVTKTYTATTAVAVGVVVDVAANDDDASECQVRIDTGSRDMWQWDGRGMFGGWGVLAIESATSPIDTYRIVMTRGPASLDCVTTRAGQVPIPLTRALAKKQHTRAGLFARNLDAKFRYIAVYTSP